MAACSRRASLLDIFLSFFEDGEEHAASKESQNGQEDLIRLIPAVPRLAFPRQHLALGVAALPVLPAGPTERRIGHLVVVVAVVDLVVVLVRPNDAGRALAEFDGQVHRHVGVVVPIPRGGLGALPVLVDVHRQRLRAVVRAAHLEVVVLAVDLSVGAVEVGGHFGVREVHVGVVGVVLELVEVGVDEGGDGGGVGADGGVGAVPGLLGVHGVHDDVVGVVGDAGLGQDGVVGPHVDGVVVVAIAVAVVAVVAVVVGGQRRR
mmetsp:Transcript_10234/g.22101  ORF Transcript_10234/g.22101 Transcript_10234/m.22101 type:complete len:262 (-) Transcript_10234:215-1000(-)